MKSIGLYGGLTLALCILFSTQSTAQADLFDFWIGTWELTWNDSSKGKNEIKRELNDFVICEYFTDNKNQYIGRSWTVYDTLSNTWRQTWVDNQGAYLAFSGGNKKEGPGFERQFTNKNGKKIHQRMLFLDIQPDSFTWDWQRSMDEGLTWISDWKIGYKRKK
jgi:hypothetical protein